MDSIFLQIVIGLNLVANTLGRYLLAPIGWLPGWLSVTLIAVVTGVLLLGVFKYTSNQRAIRKVRDDIKAHLLALKLFKDSPVVIFQSQGRIFWGALRLLGLAIIPMLVMIVPVCFLMAQLALWYQARPLHVGEEAVITLKIQDQILPSWPDVVLEPNPAVNVVVGPVRVLSQREICWNIEATKAGYHQLRFRVDRELETKALAIGNDFMRVSQKRPASDWSEIVLYPMERPFLATAPIESIEIDYPERDSYIHGTDWWIVSWFAISMVAALLFRPVLNVHM